MADLKDAVRTIAALAAVERTVFEEAKAGGADTSVPERALATVDAWLRGEPLTKKQLEKQAQACFRNVDRFWKLRGAKKTPYWANLAAARLCSTAADGKDYVTETLDDLRAVLSTLAEVSAEQRYAEMYARAERTVRPRRKGALARRVAALTSVTTAIVDETFAGKRPKHLVALHRAIDAWLDGRENQAALVAHNKVCSAWSHREWPKVRAQVVAALSTCAEIALGECPPEDDVGDFTLKSVLKENARVRDRLVAMLALAKKKASAAKPAHPTPAKRPGIGLETLARKLDPLVIDVLRAMKAEREPNRRIESKRVRALLAKRGYPAHAAALAYERDYGGLLLPTPGYDDWFDSGDYTCFGPFSCLDGWSDSPKGAKDQKSLGLVPVARVGDVVYFLDRKGRGFAQDLVGESASAELVSERADALTSRVILWTWIRPKIKKRRTPARELAAALGVPSLRRASDALERWWGDRDLIVQGDKKPAATTTVASLTSKGRERLR
jgi:hypothetical protein